MAFELSTWYAKRIIGDTAASDARNALLQTGTDITGDIWILNRTNRTTAYGIKYTEGTNGADKIEFAGGNPSTTAAWIQLDTGDAYFKGDVEVVKTLTVGGVSSSSSFTNDAFTVTKGGIHTLDGNIWAGVEPSSGGNISHEYDNGVKGGSGRIYFYSQETTLDSNDNNIGSRGIYGHNADPNSAGTHILRVNQSNNIDILAKIDTSIKFVRNTNHIVFKDERMNNSDYTAGWASTSISFTGNDNNQYAGIGTYGAPNEFRYIYIGAMNGTRDYEGTEQVRIWKNGTFEIVNTAPAIKLTRVTDSGTPINWTLKNESDLFELNNTTSGGSSLIGDAILGFKINPRLYINQNIPTEDNATLYALYVNGTANITGATALGNTLSVTGTTTISNDLTVSGSHVTSLGGTLIVAGATTLNNGLDLAGGITLTDTSNTSGHIYLTGTASTANSTTTQILFTNNSKSTEYVAITATTGNSLVINPTSNTTSGQIVLTPGSGSYFSSGSLAVNTTSQSGYTFYVNGTTCINIGSSDTVGSKRFTILGDSRFLSIGAAGIQAYSTSNNTDSASSVVLNGNGGNIYLGKSNDSSQYVEIRATTAAVSSSDGALKVDGGVGIAKKLYIGGLDSDTDISNGAIIVTKGSIKALDGHIWAGQFTANTAQSSEYDIGAKSGAGTIYLYSASAINGDRGLYTKNAGNTGTYVIKVNQSNQIENLMTLNTDIVFSAHGNVIKFKEDRVDTSLTEGAAEQGWASAYLQFLDKNNTQYAAISTFGGTTGYQYMYIGSNAYNSKENLRIYPNGAISVSSINIQSTDPVAHLNFNRSNNPNYIIFPSGSSLAFGTATGTANCIIFNLTSSGTAISSGSIYPGITNKVDLGTSSLKFKDIYGATFSGNAATATKWSSSTTVYVALGSAGTNSTIQGGESNAVTLKVNGTLGTGNGGTGNTSFTAKKILYNESATKISSATNVEYIASQDAELGSTKGKVNGLFIYGTAYGNTATNLGSSTTNVFRYGDPGPQIRFSTSTGTNQAGANESGAIIWSDHSTSTNLDSAFYFVGRKDSSLGEANVGIVTKSIVAQTRLTIGENYSNNSWPLYVNGSIGTTDIIYIYNKNMDLSTANNGASNTLYSGINGRDKNGKSYFSVEGQAESDGDTVAALCIKNYDGSTDKGWSSLKLTKTKSGTVTCDIPGATTVASSITAKGHIYNKHGTVDIAQSDNDITSNAGYGFYGLDKNGRDYTRCLSYALTSGETRLYLQARNHTGSAYTTYGGIIIKANKSNNNIDYEVTTPANFRSAISAPSTTGSGASGSWAIDITGNAATTTLLKCSYSNGTAASSTWSHSKTGYGDAKVADVWGQKWTVTGQTYTPSGGSATNLTDSGDVVFFVSKSNTSNKLYANMTIDGNIYATTFVGAVSGNVTGNCSGSSGSCTGNAATATTLETSRSIWGQSFDGSADISGHFTMKNTSSRYHYFYIKQHNTDNYVAYLMYDSGNATNVAGGRWRFAQYSPNTTNNTSTTGHIETYYLPIVATGLDEDKTYNILTSKDLSFSITGSSGSCTGNAETATKLAHTTLNSTTINNTAGSFAFSGSGDPWSGTDWVGLQIGDNSDKFQISANGNTLVFRQNDSGGTNTSWLDWVTMLTSANYTTYTVKKDGTGASGTWAIDISGKATKDGSGNTITSYYCTLSTAQTITGAKTFKETPKIQTSNGTPQIDWYSKDTTGARGGIIYLNMVQTNSIYRCDKFVFRQYSYNADTGATLSYYENYVLPAVNSGRSSSATYTILTTKNWIWNRTTTGSFVYGQQDGTTCFSVKIDTLGTTTAEGITALVLGNSSSSTTDKNQTGRITLYNSNGTSISMTASRGTLVGATRNYINVGNWFSATGIANAVWNDYAECRNVDTDDRGYCVTETASGQMVKTTERLQAGCKITSDTFGTCMGETAEAKTPIAVSGRVLVYPYRAREEYKLGAAVCSAPGGKVDIMTRDEIIMYPERIVGTVSEIPTYEIWRGGLQDGKNDIQVNGRIWIYVR